MNTESLIRDEQGLTGFSNDYATYSKELTSNFDICKSKIQLLINNGFLSGDSVDLLQQCLSKVDVVISDVNARNVTFQRDLDEIRTQTRTTEVQTQDAFSSLLSVDPTQFKSE